MIVYKAAKLNTTPFGTVVITLEIPDDALHNIDRASVIQKETAAYRCNKARVLEICDAKDSTIQHSEVNSGILEDNIWKFNLIYKVGEMVEEPSFDTNIENICTEGIHYFLSRRLAEDYYNENKENTYSLETGLLLQRRSMLEGMLHGIYEEWYPTGKKKLEQEVKEGVAHGVTKEYDEQGLLHKEYNLENGLLEGDYWENYPSGSRKVKKTFVKNSENGIHYEWHPNGYLFWQCPVKDGEFNGLFEAWDSQGNPKGSVFYENGQIVSVRRE